MGFDNGCGKPHPSTCRNALRTNECAMEECKFYHFKSTIRKQKKTNQEESGQEKRADKRENNQSQEVLSYVEVTRRQQEVQTARDQVFLEAQSSMLQMIRRIEARLDIQQNNHMNPVGWQDSRPLQQTQNQNQSWQQHQNQAHIQGDQIWRNEPLQRNY